MKVGIQINSHLLNLALLLLTLLGNGCVNLEPQSDPTRYFILSNPAKSENKAEGELQIGIQPVSIVEYLRSPRMVVRHGSHEIVYSEFNRWGEPLENAIGRALADSLGKQTNIESSSSYPWTGNKQFNYLCNLTITRFEGDDKGAAHLHATWTLQKQENNNILREGNFRATSNWEKNNYETLANALSQLLDDLASQIASSI